MSTKRRNAKWKNHANGRLDDIVKMMSGVIAAHSRKVEGCLAMILGRGGMTRTEVGVGIARLDAKARQGEQVVRQNATRLEAEIPGMSTKTREIDGKWRKSGVGSRKGSL